MYAINASTPFPVFQINKHIGVDDELGQGICGTTFSREFFELNELDVKLITIYINTIGGGVQDGFEIFNAIINSKHKTKSVITGFAYSTGGWCALSADVVEAYDYATWMCHLPYNPSEPTQTSPFLDMVCNSISQIIAEKSGRNRKAKKSVKEVKQMLNTKVYLTAYEMYDMGLIDKVITSDGKVKKMTSESEVNNLYKEYQKVCNKFIEEIKIENKEKVNNMETISKEHLDKIVNRLELSNGSDHNSVIAEIARRENEFKALNLEKETIENKLKAANESQEELNRRMLEVQNASNKLEIEKAEKETALNSAKEQLEAINAELATLKSEKEAADNKMKEELATAHREKCVNMVSKFVQVGKVKDEESVINGMVDMAVVNFEATEAMLENLPTNMHVPKPVQSTEAAVDASKDTMAKYRAANLERVKAEQEKRVSAFAAQ